MIIHGDALERLKLLPGNSVDAVVTDPPYHLVSIVKRFGKEGSAPAQFGKDGSFSRLSGGFMGKQWDGLGKNGEGIAHNVNLWKECLRVMKPGAFLLSFAGTRTYHRMACAIEDAGFEIRDMISWLYGSGFPKSLNIGKQVDKIQGNEREIIGEKIRGDVQKAKENGVTFAKADANKNNKDIFGYGTEILTKGNSEYEGWGTALKPACEPIVVARKPLSEKNVALNVLKWGTGGINIDECRVGTDEVITNHSRGSESAVSKGKYGDSKAQETHQTEGQSQGRFPANIILDEEAGKMLDEQSGVSRSSSGKCEAVITEDNRWKDKKGISTPGHKVVWEGRGDKGGASRFFYCVKASKSERNLGCDELKEIESIYPGANTFDKEGNRVLKDGSTIPPLKSKNNHPTVKPIKLMEYLVKLVSKEGSTVLDPFLGSGTTAIACIKLNRKWVGIEREEDYIKIIQARIKPFTKDVEVVKEDVSVKEPKIIKEETVEEEIPKDANVRNLLGTPTKNIGSPKD